MGNGLTQLGPQFATLMGTLAFGLRADDPPVFSDALEVRATLYYYHYHYYDYY